METKNRRSRFVIKKGLQFRYMGVILLTMLFLTMIACWTIYFTIWSRLATGDLKSAADLSKIFEMINGELLIRIPLFALLLALASLFISHRIAGPIYRFEVSAKTIANGDLTLRVKLRKGDELQHLAECFNLMAENLENLVITDRQTIKQIICVIKELPMELTRNDFPENKKKEVMDNLIKIVDDLKTITRSFKIQDGGILEGDDAAESQEQPAPENPQHEA
ncbi:MAG: HAMP domain-containing protein [Candidatus Wallbacteria bacterium]|nr:HAMP domain-containing protein [Candidatus Wallbacteria bacterium]